MLQKAMIGALVLSLLGIAGIGVYDAGKRSSQMPESAGMLQQVSTEMGTLQATAPAGTGIGQVTKQANGGTPSALSSAVGDPWSASGTITRLDDTGMMLAVNDGAQVYIELGPATYWKAQGVTLAINDTVRIEGFSSGDQFHAATVTKSDGTRLTVRTPDGKPLWAGSGQNNTSGQSGQGGGTDQIPSDAWVTLDGTVTAINGATLTVNTDEKGELKISLGNPSFMQSQNVTFAAGNKVKLLGFWQGTQFEAGEINNLTTGQRYMLRDPNGRPLWAGPGRSGQSGGQGQGNGQDSGSVQGSGQSNGNGQGNRQGSGNGQRNGQGNGNGQGKPQGRGRA